MAKTDTGEVKLPENEFKLIGGNLSLDFANSLYDWGESYPQLVGWSAKAGIFDEETASRLIKIAEAHPAEANRVFEQAHKLRQLIYNVFSAIAAGNPLAVGDMADLNSALSLMKEQLELVKTADGFKWDWKKGKAEPGLDRMLLGILRAAADLMTGGELDRVKECPGQGCDRLFVDLSRNRSRRWCDMDHCGMLLKSRRRYAKIRQTRSALSG